MHGHTEKTQEVLRWLVPFVYYIRWCAKVADQIVSSTSFLATVTSAAKSLKDNGGGTGKAEYSAKAHHIASGTVLLLFSSSQELAGRSTELL